MRPSKQFTTAGTHRGRLRIPLGSAYDKVVTDMAVFGSSPPPSRQVLARLGRWARQPTLHFFVVGALLFVAHRAFIGDGRVIRVPPGVRADLTRRFRDHQGRDPTADELAAETRRWTQDEALYREALREGLDRDDATIRTVLADRLRARAAASWRARVPTQDELERYLATHRARYESPPSYAYELVRFAKTEPAAASARERYARALAAGVAPASLGRPVVGGDLTADLLSERLGPELAAAVTHLAPGAWTPFEDRDALLLVRLIRVAGGLPPEEELRVRLVADWTYDERQRAVDAAVAAIVHRYRFEDAP